MKTLTNLSLSGLIGIVTFATSVLSALIAGPFADLTLYCFGALVVWAIYQVGAADEPRSTYRRPATRANVVAFKPATEQRLAA